MSPYLHQHLLFSSFLKIMAILVGGKRYLILLLLFNFLVTKNVEHLFVRFLPICLSALKCLCMSFAHFLIGLLLTSFA